MKYRNYFFTIILVMAFIIVSCSKNQDNPKGTANTEDIQKMEQQFKDFAKPIEAAVSKAYTDAALTYWNASLSGKSEDFDKATAAQNTLNNIFADKDNFAKMKKFRESGLIKDQLLKRDLELMYLSYLGNQIDTAKLAAMTKLSNEVTQKFQTYRCKIDGKEITDNQVDSILKNSHNPKELEKVWTASKMIGPVVEPDMIKLVKLRNEVAKELGFSNYHEMSLKLTEEDPNEILAMFDQLDSLTRPTFVKLKNEMDDYLAKQDGVKPEDLMPWEYQNRFFQEAPKIYNIDFDKYYKGHDVVKIDEDYYASLHMPIDKMVAKSDLYEKPGKLQHAFCTDINRDAHDNRVLANVVNDNEWMNTLLHEFGHAVYFYYQDSTLPWFIKTPAQIFTTEGMAMMFGRFSTNAQFMQDMLHISDKEKANISDVSFKMLRLDEIVFSRWAQVMYRFEKSMYENPDQDLNKLWWDLVEKYQMMKKPAGRNMPDWATKVHIATSPCYYHNYLLGELFASQVYHHITTNILKLPENAQTSFYGHPEVGQYLIDNVFGPGAKYYWNDMIEKATGEKLTPKYYAMQFVEK